MDSVVYASLVDQVVDELALYGIECGSSQAQLMVDHLGLVIEKNKVVNLTRITEPSDAVSRHIVDSLLPLSCQLVSEALNASKSLRFLDMGTGAGFPGIPVAILTGMDALLVDSVGKKVAAVNEFINELDLQNVSAKHCRVEELAVELPESFDLVFARAVAQSNVLIEYAAPLLKLNGLLVLEKAHVSVEELSAASKAGAVCAMRRVSRETFELPHELGHREILVFKKTGKSKIKLPRAVGMAKKKPLGM